MRNHEVQEQRLKGFCVGSDSLLVYDWHDHTRIRNPRGEPAVAAYDSEDDCAHFLRATKSADQVRAYVALLVSSTHRQNKDCVIPAQAATEQPIAVRCLPAVIVDARGEFGDIIGRRVALDAGELAEIVDRMRSVGCAATNAKKEKPAPALPHFNQKRDCPL